MNIATGIVSKPNFLQPAKNNTTGSQEFIHKRNVSSSLKLTSSWAPNCGALLSKPKITRDKWMELQGIKNWEGMLDPLDDGLRHEILRYGEFVEAAYRCFDFDTSSPGYATCRHTAGSMLSHGGLSRTGYYKVTKSLHATCGANLPGWTESRVPSWASTQSSWVGYVAVCNDQAEIARLGRRDVVIAYRGTATCMEWVENLRVSLTALPEDMARADRGSMVQSGLLSLYTSSNGMRPSLRDSIRDEVRKILTKYGDEPLSITVTGHSLGAALATLTAHDINTTFEEAPLVTVVSFGGPRVGNENFRNQLEKSGTKVLRIVNSDDPVTKVPGFVLNETSSSSRVNGETGVLKWIQKRVEETQWVYAEIGKELRLSSKDCPDLTDGGVATCHDLKTYLHLVGGFVSSNCPLRTTANRVLNRSQREGFEFPISSYYFILYFNRRMNDKCI